MAVPVVTEWQDENCRQSLEEYLNRIAQEDAAWVGRIVLAHLNPPTPPQSDRRMININGRWVPFDEVMGPREDSIWDQPPGEVVSGFYGERHRWQPMEGHFMGEPQDAPAEAEEEAPAATEISQAQWDAIVPLLEANRLDSDNVVVVSPDMVAYVQEGDAIRAVQLTDINPDAVPDEQPEDVEPTGKQVSPDDLDDLFAEIDGLVQEGEE